MAEAPQLHVEFYADSQLNPGKTKEAGREIYEDVELVRIRFPGDKLRSVVAPANEMAYSQDHREQMTYIDRFPEHYAAFKKNVEFVSGTPLAMIDLTPAKVAEFKAMSINTVEQLAEVADRTISKMGMGAREYVEKARDFLKGSDSIAEVAKLKSRIAELEGAKQTSEPDEFPDFSDDDLRNMLKDAGAEVHHKTGRAKLVEKLKELQREAA